MVTFWILAGIIVLGALGVITLKQPVHAALSLVATLIALAVTYVTLQAHFLAAIQVIVYAGAIMVLFLFVLMLLGVGGEEQRTPRFAWARTLAFGIGAIAAGALAVMAFLEARPLADAAVIADTLQGGGAGQIALVLFTEYALAFQLVGVLLLTAMVAAVSMVQRKAGDESAQPQAKKPLRHKATEGKRELVR